MPPPRATRPAARADEPARGRAGGRGDAAGPPAAGGASLVARLDAAEEAGDVDARQLADRLGVTAGALRAALAAPHALTAEQAAAVAGALGVDAATMRALRRPPAGGAAAPPGAAPNGSAPAGAAAGAPSTLALLDAVLRAVRGDAAGVRLRAAVLDACEAAARAAGRPLPPGAHALRARLATAGGPDAGPGDDGAADDGTGDGAEVVAAAAALVRELQHTAPGYDGLFAPLHDDALEDVLRRHGVRAHAAPGAPAGSRFVLTPPLYGRQYLVLAAAASPDQRRLAARAALAHLLAGHVAEDRPLASPAPPMAARLADVVALADLLPFWQLADLRRRGRLGWGALAAHVAAEARRTAGDWDDARAADRAAGRVALFRHHQL